MQDAQEIYRQHIAHWPMKERLHLAALILNDLTTEQNRESAPQKKLSILELINSFAPGRGFKTSAEADEYLRQERDSWDR